MMKRFLKRLVIVGLIFYALFAFMSLQTNPLKWDAVTRVAYSSFLIGWGVVIYLDMDVKELWDQIKKEN